MPAITAKQIWYRRISPTPPNENLVHAVMENEREALCGEDHIVYHLDETFDFVPEGAKVHDACREAAEKRNRA